MTHRSDAYERLENQRIEIEQLRKALTELAAAADVVEHSTDRDHWARLDRAIEQARKLVPSARAMDERCAAAEPCATPDECRLAGLCLGSNEGVAYQEARMRAFFERPFADIPSDKAR